MSGVRVFGLSGSGMDIDQIVSDMMKVERDRTVTKLERDKQIDIWQKEIYQETNEDMANFILDLRKDLELASASDTGTMINKSSNSFTWVKSASSSDETKASISATAKALNGTYSLNVTQLSESVSKTSVGAITTGSGTDTIQNQFGMNSSFSFTIKTNISENDATNFPTGDKTFTFDPTVDSMDDVVDSINNAGIGVTAAYDEGLDRFFLNTSSTGSDKYFQVTSDSDNFLSDGVGDGSGNKLKLKLQTSTQYSGKDLQFDFGDATGLVKSSNTFSINGINITAKNIGTTNISVNTDVDSVYEKISNFVEKYNEMIGKINTKLSEKVYRDFQPLTSEEKEALSDNEVEKWEEKAKSGLLKNDNVLSKMMTSIREGLYDSVSGLSSTMNQLTQIGIETGEYSEKGKLVIDETKLKESIINNASGVIDLLFKEPESYTDDEDKYNKSGLVTRIFDTMVEGMKGVIDKAGPGDDSELLRDVKSTILIDFTTGKNLQNGSISILDESIMDLESSIFSQEDMLTRIENRYYSKFSAMESALNNMNQQSSWLMSQLGGI